MSDTNAHPLTKSLTPVWIGLIAAFAFWFIIFGLKPTGFWFQMSLATFSLSIWALVYDSQMFKPLWGWGKIILWGLSSALALYLLFFLGDIASSWLPFQDHQVTSIYDNRTQAPLGLITALLVIPIAPGEEIFWRGFVQSRFQSKWGAWVGFILATSMYAIVHITSLNFMLFSAALVCGAFWGLLYMKTKSVLPGIISHVVWDVVIFVLLPLR